MKRYTPWMMIMILAGCAPMEPVVYDSQIKGPRQCYQVNTIRQCEVVGETAFCRCLKVGEFDTPSVPDDDYDDMD